MPSHTTITDAAAKRFACKSGRVDHFDGSHPGLVLRVSATGRKTWMYFYRTQNGKIVQHRMKLGLFPEMGVQEAHDAWRTARDLVAAGRDPLAVEDKELPAKSFVSVFEEWLKLDRVKKNGQPKRSIDQVERALRRTVLPSWKDQLITNIDRRAALAVLDALNNEGKSVQANRVHSYLHRMFAWCVGREIIDKNPLEKVERVGAEIPRTRALSDTELAKVWRATEKLQPEYRDFYRIIILTAARREEIAQLRWDEIRDDHIYLEGESTKNGQPHVIPLSSAARAMIAGIKRKGRFVFTARATYPSRASNARRSGLTTNPASAIGAPTISVARLPMACRSSACRSLLPKASLVTAAVRAAASSRSTRHMDMIARSDPHWRPGARMSWR